MHELSIASSIVEMASAAARDAGAAQISAVHLRIGALAGVVPDALRFSFAIVAGGTPLDGAELRIEELPVVVYCPRCAAEVALADPRRFRCPRCDELCGELRQGRELELVALETV